MLYCPKCQRTYEEGTQRFCDNDGGRLLPAVTSPKAAEKTGVFSNLIGKMDSQKGLDEKLAAIPRYVKTEVQSFPTFEISRENPVFDEPAEDVELELEPFANSVVAPPLAKIELPPIAAPPVIAPPLKDDAPATEPPAAFVLPDIESLKDESVKIGAPPKRAAEPAPPAPIEPATPQFQVPTATPQFESQTFNVAEPEKKSTPEPDAAPEILTADTVAAPIAPPVKPLARIINSSEIPSGTALTGDRKTNPTGRLALTRENPKTLFGQFVKNRYYIVKLLGQDEMSLSFLAEDKFASFRKFLVRVFMNEETGDDLTKSIYAEERVSLSHINHPNIVKVVDSGELLEGKPFIVTEYTEAPTVADELKNNGQFNVQRTARLIRQAAYALSETHQNGILHRNLKPENLLLTVSDKGAEQIKVTNFGVAGSRIRENVSYQAPEVLDGSLANVASDVYSLAAIAFQMLTAEPPFGKNGWEILKLQRAGLRNHPSDVRTDVPRTTDEIFDKALSFQPTERFSKARDFGDALFNALTTAAAAAEMPAADTEPEKAQLLSANSMVLMPLAPTFEQKNVQNVPPAAEFATPKNPPAPAAIDNETAIADESPLIPADIHITPREPRAGDAPNAEEKRGEIKTDEPAWTRRSPEPPKTSSRSLILFALLGLAILAGGIWLSKTYLANRQTPPESPTEPANSAAAQPLAPATETVPAAKSAEPTPRDIEVPPISRSISQPPNTVFFQNTKQNVTGDLLKNFLGFSIYYPKDWQVNESVAAAENSKSRGKFLDISKKNADGAPIEQMLVSYYPSKGTFKEDLAAFPVFVKETNDTLKKIVPKYQLLSEKEIQLNGGWKAYEVKFQGGGPAANGEQVNLWGRRLFIPAARVGVKNGYEITMLATSFSPVVQNVDDVGVKGELGTILETFEPDQNY